MDCSWRAMPARATSLVVRSYQAYVHYWFRQSENNFLVSGMFTGIVLLGIPAGAFFNALRGGSPFLLILLASLVLVFITLTILTETSRLRAWLASFQYFYFWSCLFSSRVMFSIHLRTGFSTSQSRALLLVASSLSHYFISQRNQVCSQSLNFSRTWGG